MAKITSTIWSIDPHTEAKHGILRKYLDAWLPIMARWNGRILYIDGFAGPGEYMGGKDGSPSIAIKAVLEHKANLKSEIIMIFIEANKERYEYLKQKINLFKIPRNIQIEYICAKFADTLTGIFKYLDEQRKGLSPAFVFIDPFGFTGIPMTLIKRIMENAKCEVLITFMYEEINRFIGDNKLWDSLIETFGTDKWKQIISEKDPRKRMKSLHAIYKEQLECGAGIKFVRSFKMVNKVNKTDYFLFFGTNNIIGLKKMKEAMWRIDKSGLFQFSDVTDNPNQPVLFDMLPNYSQLKNILLQKFKGKSVGITELENFILTQTPFRETHYKKQILGEMEKAQPPEIKVKCQTKRRKGTFISDCIVEFL
ncbi:MAG: three-Cys-motif partner protein TcmP [Elusimicrobia bacterium]|nr:three-Cys-motif partner protein TcmP [Elusimicrobiota bacterium]